MFWNVLSFLTLRKLAKFFSLFLVKDSSVYTFLKRLLYFRLAAERVSFNKFGKQQRRRLKDDFIYLGRFSDNKNIPELIKLFSFLSHTDVKLKIIGRSNSGNVGLFRKLIGECKLNVELLVDIDDTEILEHLSSAKFTVSASDYEGFGMSIIELMSYGLIPLLSEEPPSFRKFITESECGAIFSRDPALFNDIVGQLIRSWSYEKSLLATNYSLKFSWSEVEILYSDVYQKVLYPNI